MKAPVTTICTLFLLLAISCNDPLVINGEDKTAVGSIVEKVVQPNRNTVQKEKSGFIAFCEFFVEQDVFIAVLYTLILVFSYIYYKQTGKHNTALENNLSQLSKRLTWRQRVVMFLLELLHNKTNKNRRRR